MNIIRLIKLERMKNICKPDKPFMWKMPIYCVLLCLLSIPFNASAERLLQTMDDVLEKAIEEKGKSSVWAYSDEFAQRFNLPKIENYGLDRNIWAIELSVIPNYESPKYACEVHLYLNNSLSILYPDGDHGSISTLNVSGKLPSAGGSLGKSDRMHFGEQLSKYKMKAVFNSYSDKNNIGGTISYKQYRKYYFNDIAYINLNLGRCSYVGDPEQYMHEIWIEKQNGRNYLKGSKLDKSDFYVFSIPKQIIRRFYQYSRSALRINNAALGMTNNSRKISSKHGHPFISQE